MKLYNAFYEQVYSSNNDSSINLLNKRKILRYFEDEISKRTTLLFTFEGESSNKSFKPF